MKPSSVLVLLLTVSLHTAALSHESDSTTAACLASPFGEFSSPTALVEHLMDPAQLPTYGVDDQRDGMSTITTVGPRGDEIDRQAVPTHEVAEILTSKAIRARAIREFLVKSILDAGVDPACGSACPELEMKVDPACGSACPEDELLGLDLEHPACQLLLNAASATVSESSGLRLQMLR